MRCATPTPTRACAASCSPAPGPASAPAPISPSSRISRPTRRIWSSSRAELTMTLHGLFSRLTKPVVTAINGAAMGGGAGLALAGDVAVMASTARLGFPGGEARHRRRDRAGQPGAQCRAQGRVRAGRDRRAARCRARLLARHGQSRHRARATDGGSGALAEKLAAVPRAAMAATKQLFYRVVDLPFDEALEEGRDINKRMRAFRKA